jgi:hypothetical protein
VCHAFLSDARFYRLLFQIDQDLAHEVQASGCRFCGGQLHSARYPRKPRGLRAVLDTTCDIRLSFCCALDGCRRRNTPPSVRFLGRRVYLGVMVVLLSALQHGLTEKRRRELVERLEVPPQTLARWRRWWREVFPATRCWRGERSQFLPPIPVAELPGALLGRFTGATLHDRVCQLLLFIAPVTTAWSGSLRQEDAPQTM